MRVSWDGNVEISSDTWTCSKVETTQMMEHHHLDITVVD